MRAASACVVEFVSRLPAHRAVLPLAQLPDAGLCFPGSGFCAEDEHFIVWMRTAALPTFRKLYAKIDEDLLPVRAPTSIRRRRINHTQSHLALSLLDPRSCLRGFRLPGSFFLTPRIPSSWILLPDSVDPPFLDPPS